MRLLCVGRDGGLTLTKDLTTPPGSYAILSHTWAEDDEEVTFDDIEKKTGQNKAGYTKLRFYVNQAKIDGLQYCWVDRCCINKASLSELDEAIRSMHDAARCYVYLSDVFLHSSDDTSDKNRVWEWAFRKSRWFTRGWTLQELLLVSRLVAAVVGRRHGVGGAGLRASRRETASIYRQWISGPGSDQDGPISAQKIFPTTLEDVGLPLDQLWDHNAAYDRRFCFDHGEIEYLLGTANRWMSPGDFDIPNAAALLEIRLQKHKDDPLDFAPHLRKCQAECCGSLWSHVHGVVDRGEHNGASLYLVQWKVCWTPESNIDDKAWVMTSLRANQNQHNRRSMRLEDSFEDRRKGFDKMLVVNLE